MTHVRAVILPPGPRLHGALAAAVTGRGPAICPVDPALPRPARETLLAALAPAEVETTSGVEPYGGTARPPEPGTAVFIATSGSTGTPKIVELAGDALTASAEATLTRLDARDGGRWLCCLPTSHIAGVQVLVRALVSGTEPVIHERFDPAAVLDAGDVRVSLVPTQLRRLLDTGSPLGRLRSILLGGAAAPAGLIAEARDRGARILTTYGMSETSGGCVYDGRPLDGVEIALGGDGLVRIAGPTLFTGYRLRPDLTDRARDGKWFLTQDLAALDGGVLRIRGRADDVINTGGEKVVAGEVQDRLARHPAVRDVAVVGGPDPEWGEAVTAFVVPAGTPATLAELRAWVRETMPAAAAPRAVHDVAAIPLLPSGKPDRAELRRRATRR